MSASAVASPVDTGILLEAGTNEAEVLVFRVHNRRFGVNVAKVREVLPIEDVTDVPKSDLSVDGLVDIRETVVPLVNLRTFLYGEMSESEKDATTQDSMVLLEFNKQQIAFRVQSIERIYRVSWKDTLPAPQLGREATPITSVLRQEKGLVPLLDFESICETVGIGGATKSHDHVATEESVQRSHMPIVVADDSRLICQMIEDSLIESGYTAIKSFPDGYAAWEYLDELANTIQPEQIGEHLACVITDIEMPRLDGLSLTKKIRSHAVLADIPVIVFSSIATKDNEKKGHQVGATAQVSKPHYDDLVASVSDVLGIASTS